MEQIFNNFVDGLSSNILLESLILEDQKEGEGDDQEMQKQIIIVP